MVPVKAFTEAKSRLSPVLTPGERVRLAQAMLEDVLTALTSVPEIAKVVVVTPSVEVGRLALAYAKTLVIHDDNVGQLPAVNKAVSFVMGSLKPEAILLTVADVPLIRPWDLVIMLRLARKPNTLVLAPSNDRGTNVMVQHPPGLIELRYGRESFFKHVDEAKRGKIPYVVYLSESVALDVDTPSDLHALRAYCASAREPGSSGTRTCALVRELAADDLRHR